MILGKTIGNKGATYDSTYFYFGDIDLTKIKAGHHSTGNNPFSIYVAEKEFFLNKGAKKITDFTNYNNIFLPFRYPMMVVYSALFAHPTYGPYYFPGATSICNSDFGLNIGAADTPALGHYNELTIDLPGFDKLWLDAKWGHIYPALYSKNISDTPRDIAYYEGLPIKFITYPTSIQMYSVTDGELYVVYNVKCKLVASCENERITRDFNTSSTVNFHHRTYKETPNILIDSNYDNKIIYIWETPAIAHYSFNGSKFTLNKVGYPMGIYTNKIDSTKGLYTWNTKIIPYQNIPASNGSYFQVPSRNRCFIDSFMDVDNDRLVVAHVYETANNSSYDTTTWPETFKLYISYFDTSAALTFIPDSGPVNINLSSLLSSNIDNVHKISITKWGYHYIVAISTDTIENNIATLRTIIVKIDSTASLVSSEIVLVGTFKNSGFTDVHSHIGL